MAISDLACGPSKCNIRWHPGSHHTGLALRLDSIRLRWWAVWIVDEPKTNGNIIFFISFLFAHASANVPYRVALRKMSSPPNEIGMCWTPSGIVSNWSICSFRFCSFADHIWRTQCERLPSTGTFDRCPSSQRKSLLSHSSPSTCETYLRHVRNWGDKTRVIFVRQCQQTATLVIQIVQAGQTCVEFFVSERTDFH